ncbi:MAG TPA: DUF2849 domain-containing protein [Paracoccaceae bacterium]|nr:DUF2849 domain-containing protein [Paracoccaceae bacterium]
MPKPFVPKIVSANDLMEGDVVYLDAAAGWTRDLAAAAVAHDPEAAETLLARADQPGRVVGPYLADVATDGAAPRPLHYREIFRTRGPSNRPDLGRQAES